MPEHINATADEFLTASVDTKKKELVGNFRGPGMAATPPVRVHDFPTDAEGKAIPYGIYDMARNEAWVSVGATTTPRLLRSRRFGCGGIGWVGTLTHLYITADAGVSRGTSSRADETGLTIHGVTSRPARASKIEHRLFCSKTAATFETIVDRIATRGRRPVCEFTPRGRDLA